MKPVLPRDWNSEALQVVAPTGVHVKMTAGPGSTSQPFPVNEKGGGVVRVAATENCYIKFGDSGVTATANDVLFPAGVEYFSIPPGTTHVACIQVDTVGPITFTEML